jgi:hypothetical protein
MTNPLYVKPAEGARIRQPNRNSRVMPPEGDYVSPNDVYYVRLISSGDVIVCDPPTETKPDQKAEAKKK